MIQCEMIPLLSLWPLPRPGVESPGSSGPRSVGGAGLTLLSDGQHLFRLFRPTKGMPEKRVVVDSAGAPSCLQATAFCFQNVSNLHGECPTFVCPTRQGLE